MKTLNIGWRVFALRGIRGNLRHIDPSGQAWLAMLRVVLRKNPELRKYFKEERS